MAARVKKRTTRLNQVVLNRQEWEAIVRYFRAEEKVMRDSYGCPGEKRRWREEYERMDFDGHKLYEAARIVIDDTERGRRG